MIKSLGGPQATIIRDTIKDIMKKLFLLWAVGISCTTIGMEQSSVRVRDFSLPATFDMIPRSVQDMILCKYLDPYYEFKEKIEAALVLLKNQQNIKWAQQVLDVVHISLLTRKEKQDDEYSWCAEEQTDEKEYSKLMIAAALSNGSVTCLLLFKELLAAQEKVIIATAALDAAEGDLLEVLDAAVSLGNTAAVKALLKQGVDPQKRYVEDRFTVLMSAAVNDRAEMIRLLLSDEALIGRISRIPDPDEKDPQDEIGRIKCVAKRILREREDFINAVTDLGKTALLLAVEFNKGKAAQALLEAGANPDKADHNPYGEYIPPHEFDHKHRWTGPYPGASGWTPLFAAVAELRPDLVRLLLAHGADPNVMQNVKVPLIANTFAILPNKKDLVGGTPLRRAIVSDEEIEDMLEQEGLGSETAEKATRRKELKESRIEIVRMLLADKRIDVNRGEKDEDLPIHNAVRYREFDKTITEMLSGACADWGVVGKDQKTAYQIRGRRS